MTTKPKVLRKLNGKGATSRVLSFRLSTGIDEGLKALAKKNRLTRNNLVALILYEYIEKNGEKVIKTHPRSEKTGGDDANIFA